MKTSVTAVALASPIMALLCACSHRMPDAEVLRPVRAVELRYGNATETNRYVGTVQARHEVDQAFRVGGKVLERRVEIGQLVREGDVLAVLDDTDYRLAVEAAQQALNAARTQASQADSDRKRLESLKSDGSVSISDDEHADSSALTARASAEAETRKLDLARNRLTYTVLRASQSGVITATRFEVGQVVAEGQPVISIANQAEPEIVIDIPEDHLKSFQTARFRASLASTPDETFAVVLRELAPQAAQQTRTYRARLKPEVARALPLGATAAIIAERPLGDTSAASVPASAITQSSGQPAVWIVHPTNTDAVGTVELTRVTVHGYRNDQVLVSGPKAGELVVVAGVQKMAPGLRVALTPATSGNTALQAAR